MNEKEEMLRRRRYTGKKPRVNEPQKAANNSLRDASAHIQQHIPSEPVRKEKLKQLHSQFRLKSFASNLVLLQKTQFEKRCAQALRVCAGWVKQIQARLCLSADGRRA